VKSFAVLLIVVLLSSCTPFLLNTQDYKVQSMDLDTAWKLVSSYNYIPEKKDYWKSPNEFFDDGGGDCEDFAATMMYLLGPESSMIIIITTTDPHAIVSFHNIYFEPQTYGKFYNVKNITTLTTYTFFQTMFIATKGGSKNL